MSETFEDKCDFMKWLQASDNIAEVPPFGFGEGVVLEIGFILKAEQLNPFTKLNSSLKRLICRIPSGVVVADNIKICRIENLELAKLLGYIVPTNQVADICQDFCQDLGKL